MDPVKLLKQLVSIPSLSRDEDAKATFLCRFLEEEGDLLLSGIIDERGDEVLASYEKEGMLVKSRKSREGWTMLHLGKKV